MISRARRNATMRNLSFSIGDAVDFCSSCCDRFELVWLVGVLGHLPDQGAMLAAAHGVLTSRGRLIVISVHPWNPWTRIKRLMDGGCEAPPADDPSPSRLCRLAEQNGFGLIGLEPLPYAAWPELAAVRGRGGTSIRAPRDHAWTGLLRGALAAEFDRRGC